jgi:hypothetical protein
MPLLDFNKYAPKPYLTTFNYPVKLSHDRND